MKNQKIVLSIIDTVGLTAILLTTLFYAVFWSSFAEINIRPSFLRFPVFVGEILLAFCGCLFLLKIFLGGQSAYRIPKPWWIGLGVYVLFIIIKAAEGYCSGGELAFRHAALFYYPLFAFFGFYFYKKDFFGQRARPVIFTVLLMAFWIFRVKKYVWLSYFLVLFILARSIRQVWLRQSAYALLAVTVMVNFESFFLSSRSHGVGLVFALLFLVVFHLRFVKDHMPRRRKFLAAAVVIVLFVFGVVRFSDKNAIESLSTPVVWFEKYKALRERIVTEGEHFVFEPLPVRLYNPNLSKNESIDAVFQARTQDWVPIDRPSPEIIEIKTEQAPLKVNDLGPSQTISNLNFKDFQSVGVPGQNSTADVVQNPQPSKQYRSLDVAYNNIFFRLFIWRDMMGEVVKNREFLGVSFGEPQRSRSMEVLGWARGEWERDGWVTPHNSFLHMIYRAGIIGVLVILVLFWVVVQMVQRFVAANDLTGSLLVSMILYWMSLASFLLIFELPYSAVPFWTLFGMTLAYSFQCRPNENSRRP